MISYFARHPTAANLLMLILLVAGAFSLSKLRRETLPDFTLPDAYGKPVTLHAFRAGRPAVVVFYRSAVW